MKLEYIMFLSVALILSCSSTKTNSKIRECVENKTHRVFNEVYGQQHTIGFYEMVKVIEQTLLENNLLKKNNKEGYINLLRQADSAKQIDFLQQDLIRKYHDFVGLIIEDVIINCQYEVFLKSEVKNKFFRKRLDLANDMLKSGYEFVAVRKYIENFDQNDFNLIENRAPIIVVFLFKIRDKNADNERLNFPDLSN